jgi:Flp pilus assembly protein CpaB
MGDKPKRTSRMFMILGAVLTILAMGGVYFVATSASKSAQGKTVQVMVANRLIPAHTVFTTEADAANWFKVAAFPSSSAPAGAYSSPQDFFNKVLRYGKQSNSETIYTDQPAIPAMFTNLGSTRSNYDLSFTLKKGDVAVSLQVSPVNGSAGAIQPGDYIDIISSWLGGGSSTTGEHVSKSAPLQTQYTMQNVKVLLNGPSNGAITPTTTPGASTSAGSSSQGLLTVELSHQQALVLQHLKDFSGSWSTSVVLRSAHDHGAFHTVPVTANWYFTKSSSKLLYKMPY